MLLRKTNILLCKRSARHISMQCKPQLQRIECSILPVFSGRRFIHGLKGDRKRLLAFVAADQGGAGVLAFQQAAHSVGSRLLKPSLGGDMVLGEAVFFYGI